jgi:transposase
MKAYSEDLRQKIVTALERGTSKAQAARLFDVSLSSVKRYASKAPQRASLAPKKGSGRPPKFDENARRLLEEDIQENAPRPLLNKDAIS